MPRLNTLLKLILLCTSLVTAITTANVTKVYQAYRAGWIENFMPEAPGQLIFIDTSTTKLRRVNINSMDDFDLSDIFDFAIRDGATTVQGFVHLHRGRYVVIGLKCHNVRFACSRGISYVYTVVVAPDRMVLPVVKRVQMLPDVTGLNGMTSLDGRDLILVADSLSGGLWGMNLATGQHKFIWSDFTMRGTENDPIGINGIRVHRDVLYYTNSAMGTFHSVKIDTTGRPITDPFLIAAGLIGIDDFELDLDKDVAYVCQGGAVNRIAKIDISKGHVSTVCRLRGPTAVHWADRRKKVLYASTNGYDGAAKASGGIYRIVL